jgi:hypothetical protein
MGTLWNDALASLTDVFEERTPRRVSTSRRSWGIREEDVLGDLLSHGE